jgi:GH24 family phage-related lysozyme (muramidase)
VLRDREGGKSAHDRSREVPPQLAANAEGGLIMAMKTSKAGGAFIAAFEGVEVKAYPDPGTGGEPWTIGVGHTTAAGPPAVHKGMTITRDEALSILAQDLGKVERTVSKHVTHPLAQSEFDALVSLCFNIGDGNFGKSSVVRHVNAGERAQAGDAFLMWNKAAGKVMKGLTRRREAERHLFLTGDYGVAAPHEVAHA